MAGQNTHFTEPTTQYWQEILPVDYPTPAPWRYGYPARLPDGRTLVLPIRPMTNNPNEAVASLILNQAAIDVADELGAMLANIVKDYDAEVVIGLPTLGLTLAPIVAKSLGFNRYVPLGYSRKFWYTDYLSTETSSITSPDGLKKLYLDPNMVDIIKGKKAVLIDDAVSSGKTLKASWDFLESEKVGAEILAVGVLMKQSERWRDVLGMDREDKVEWVFESPLLRKVPGGWDTRE